MTGDLPEVGCPACGKVRAHVVIATPSWDNPGPDSLPARVFRCVCCGHEFDDGDAV